MKKYNKLFAILFAVLGVTTLKAQEWTDKTSLLVNPSFESETTATDLGSGKNGWGGPTGWILSPSTAPSNSQSGVIASSCNIQGIATTFPTADGGNYFYVRTNWNNDPTFALSQVISDDLPVGLYRLTCKAASNSGNWATSTFKLTLKESDGNISTNSSLNKCSEWTEWTVDLYKTDPSTSLTIEAAMRAGSSGQGQHYQMLLDDFKLEYMSFDDIEAAGWPKPQVPGSNIKSFVGTSVVAAMYNVEADAFVTRGMTWGTQAIATKLHNSDSQTQATSDRHHVKLTAGDNGKVRFSVNGKNYLGDGAQGSTTTVYTDNGNTQTNQFIYEQLNNGTYRLKVGNATSDVDALLDVAQPYGGQLTYANGQGFTEWAIIKFSDIENGKYASYKAKRTMYEVYKAVVDAGHSATYSDALSTALETYIKPNATASDVIAATKTLVKTVSPALTKGYVNASALFTNPDMRGAGTKADWTTGYTNVSWGVFENFHTNHGDRKLTQTKAVPNGFYKVVFHGIWRQDGSDAAPTLTLRSGDNSVSANVPCMTDMAFGVSNTNGSNNWKDANGKIIPDGMQSAGEGLSHGSAQVTISDFVVSNEQLTIEMNTSSTSQWILAQGFDIYYKAESLEEYANLFYAAKTAAEAIDAETLNAYVADQLSTALSDAATEQIDKEWYQARTKELNDAVALANSVSPVYVNFKALVASCEAVYENSVEAEAGAKATFEVALTNAKSSIGNLQTADAITTLYNTLEEARKTYIVKADPTNDTYFDFTYMIVNPSFETGDTNGWTTSNGGDTGAKLNSNGTYTINGADGEFVYNTWGTNPMFVSQTITGLPTGLYTLKAIVASDNGTVVSLTAGTSANEVTTTDKGTATEGEVSTSCSSGELLIKASSENWFKADHFRLYYYGFDVETAQTGVATLKAEAEALVDKQMDADVASALNKAISGADATKTTRLELQPMIETLSIAISDANASIADYALIKTYIDKANTIDESIAAEYTTQYNNGTISETVEVVFQNLEVATYNYVKNEFSYPVALSSDWNTEGPVGELSDQHWSGEKKPYMEQSQTAYGQNEWTIKYDQDLILPAGEYVFKVAGRKASGNGCNLSLTVTNGEDVLGTVNDFPEGDTGYGIDTSGAANFSDEGTYANGDKGRGWQWRYVKFELTQKATVNIAVNASATTKSQWISFCDATLQMTEETYLEANMGGLDAPTAAAEALVDTKPMGTAENQALKDALALPVTTGAELLAKIDALNAAVANANAWIPKYNEAKAPLVAALERFETDYNDAENGALDYMCKSRWTTAVNMAQAAAVAKDVTDSYDGFATATENLVAALDAATVSVGEYADLKKAIDEANTLASANVGDQPFERPQSAADAIGIANAQKVYNAATADGEGVTSVTTSLNEAVTTFKAVPLNAPTEGVAYNLVLNNNNGWSYDGKAVTYIEGGRTDAGLYNISYLTEPNVNYAQAFTFTAVEDQADCYTLSMTDVDGNQRYVCTGVPYNGTTGQLRTTTNADDALVVKVIATTTDGVHNLYNTEANNYIGSQDDGFYTVNSHINFNLVAAEKAKVTLNISSAGWATLILPFNAEIPEGVTVYASERVEGELVKLTEVGSIVANTPYLIKGTKGKYEFSGYGLADKDEYKDANKLFVGTYVDYTTVGGEYVLQNHEGTVAFYRVGEYKPEVAPYRCYLTVPTINAAKAFFFDNEATGINGVDTAGAEIEAIYTINGTRVNNLQKGLNIVKMSNGKTQKVYVK